MKFIHEVLLAPSMCLFRWIKVDKISKKVQVISKIIFILGSNKFLAYLECLRSYAWSFGHLAPDPSSVRYTPQSTADDQFRGGGNLAPLRSR